VIVQRLRRGSAIMEWLSLPSVATIPAHLLFAAPACQVAHSHCGPAQFRHQFCHAPINGRSPAALGNFEQIQNFLTCHTFQPIEIYFATHTFQRQQPGISSRGGSLGLRFAYLSYERQHDLLRLYC
jgi:hypothetical protein